MSRIPTENLIDQEFLIMLRNLWFLTCSARHPGWSTRNPVDFWSCLRFAQQPTPASPAPILLFFADRNFFQIKSINRLHPKIKVSSLRSKSIREKKRTDRGDAPSGRCQSPSSKARILKLSENAYSQNYYLAFSDMLTVPKAFFG